MKITGQLVKAVDRLIAQGPGRLHVEQYAQTSQGCDDERQQYNDEFVEEFHVPVIE